MKQRFALAALLACSVVFAQEIRLSTGAVDNQVFQRGKSNSADLRLGGTADNVAGKTIEVRLTAGGKPVRGFGWRPLTVVSGATWSAELKGLPAGGPYTMELRAPGATTVVVKDLLVGDLWILAGQSNMEGVGDLIDVQPPDARVHSFTMYDDWTLAKEPLHELAAATDSVHWPKGQTAPLKDAELAKWREARKKGAGLGLPFAVEMVKRTGVPIGLIPCAHGGTSMTQWDPALKDKGGESLYGGTFRRFQATGGRVTGVLWYQGESDANPKAEPAFRQKFTGLIEAMRRDFGQPDLPFYYVQIGRHISFDNQPAWSAVQNTQRLVETAVTRVGVVPANDYVLDDGIHVGTQGLKQLATRLANLATHDLVPENKQFGGLKRGPRPGTAIYSAGPGTNAGLVKVSFTEVNGSLQSVGRPSGFQVHSADGTLIPAIFRTELDGSDVKLRISGKLPPGASLSYGWGKDPYCNLTDSAGMGMLAFSGIPISQ